MDIDFTDSVQAQQYLDEIWELYDEGEISGSDIFDELSMIVMEGVQT